MSPEEAAFFRILEAEVLATRDGDVLTEAMAEEVLSVTRLMVEKFAEATEIVDFFAKPDEIKSMKKEIRRAVFETSFGDKALVTVLQERFLGLAKARFKP